MLTRCNMVPVISAYTYLKGQHNYNAHPFAPIGCQVEMYIMLNVQEAWAPRTVTGYYMGAAWEHYRNHCFWVEETRTERVGEHKFSNISI